MTSAHLRRAAHAGLYLLLLGPALAGGAHRGWPLALTQLVALATVALWLAAMARERRLEWRPTALDLPLALLVGVVLLQVILGSGPFVRWALAPPAADLQSATELPRQFLLLGTVSRAQTWRSFLLFLTYVAAFVLVVNLVKERAELDRLVRTLVVSGGLLGFLGLLDYLAGHTWLLVWRDFAPKGRLAGTFANPDHFATWLAMLACLGLGYLVGRRSRNSGEPFNVAALASREGRERFARRYLPFVGVAVAALAIVFTLSRGGIVGLLVALAVMLGFFGRLRFARWSLVVIGLLLAVTLAYGAWIGLGPLIERVQRGALDYQARVALSMSSLPMLKAFPILGVGLGAYKEIYYRYQPPELRPGAVWFPYAHNDLLQLVVELGVLGGAVALFAAWRLGRDLLSHVLGVGACPVGAGEGKLAKRNDSFSVGIGLGALGGVAALVVHSAGDFSARIPANGLLAAALLGIAVVALHTRFGANGATLLTRVRALPAGSLRRWQVLAAAGVAVVLLVTLVVPPIVRPALVERVLAPILRGPVAAPTALAAADRAVAYDGGSPKALGTRAWYRLVSAERLWNRGSAEQRREAAALVEGAIDDLRRALAVTPADPFLHERLAWAYGAASRVTPDTDRERLGLAHLQRAVALAPDNAMLRRSLAVFAATRPAPRVDLALAAGREAIARDPGLLPDLVERLKALPLAPFQWQALVPDTAIDRLHLAIVLEGLGLLPAAREAYAAALSDAPYALQPIYLWARARMLIRVDDAPAAAADLLAALRHTPDNRELLLARATALAKLGDPEALDLLQRAVALDERARRSDDEDNHAFETDDARLRRIVADQFAAWAPPGPARGGAATRYRRALAQHLTERKLWPQALREWTAVVGRAPDDAVAHFGRGVALEALGREEALESYRRAVSLDGQPRFRERLAQRLWDTDQYHQAINEWRVVTELDPKNLAARLALARSLLHVGDRVAALRAFKAALDLAPGNAEARAGFTRLGGLVN